MTIPITLDDLPKTLLITSLALDSYFSAIHMFSDAL